MFDHKYFNTSNFPSQKYGYLLKPTFLAQKTGHINKTITVQIAQRIILYAEEKQTWFSKYQTTSQTISFSLSGSLSLSLSSLIPNHSLTIYYTTSIARDKKRHLQYYIRTTFICCPLKQKKSIVIHMNSSNAYVSLK